MARVEARTFSFEELIQQVQHGVLRCPRFQRRFVWRPDQVRELFDSIRLRYPVGSLLIWRTRERYSSFDQVGPISVPPDQPKAPAEVGYVLDGHQRISVLFGAFALDDAAAHDLHGADRAFLVYYDLECESFVHVQRPQQHHLPVRYLLGRDDELVAWLDERRDSTRSGTPERTRWDTFRRRANQLQTTFAQYRLPYLDVTEATLAEAVNIFIRVNSQGTPVKRAEVFAALTWREGGFDFAGAAKELLEQYPLFKNFGTDPVLRSLLAALDESIYADNWERVLKENYARLPEAMKAVSDAFGLALDFLDVELGASSGKVIPYSLHLVLLTEFFRLCPEPDAHARTELIRWLWATAFSSTYTSGGNLRGNVAVEQAQRLARGTANTLLTEPLRLSPFPRRFHPKSARVRAFHLFLKTRKPRDLRTGELLPGTLLRNGMADARAIIGGGGPETWRLAGRLLVGAGRRPVLEDIVVAIHASTGLKAPFKPETKFTECLRSHLIPNDAMEALLVGDTVGFLNARERELIREERIFARQFVDVPDAVEVEEDPEINVEDESEPDF